MRWIWLLITCIESSRPKRGRGQFLNCLGAPMIFHAKSVFLAVIVSLRWLYNVRGVYLVQVLLLFIGQQGLDISSGTSPCFPLAGGLCKYYDNAGGKQPIQRQPLLLQQKQQANPLLSM
jgi:hypothetical protein